MSNGAREPERIGTLVIGGGQAGLSVGYHLAKRWPPISDPRRARADRRRMAGALGLASPLHTREVRRP